MEKQAEIVTRNPANGQEIARYPVHSPAQISSILEKSRVAYGSWRRSSQDTRAGVLRRLGELLGEEKDALARLMQNEMGKTIAEGLAEVSKCIACAQYYADEGAKLLEPILIPSDARKSLVSFEPLGPVLAIMPWNFPLWQVVRCAAPSLAAGNTVLLKHASNVTGCALALERLLKEASGQEHLFRTLVIPGAAALELIPRKEIAAVSLTGSTEVGREVAAAAGRSLKKCVLELGGSDAYVVLADADVARAAKVCAQSRLLNAGQSCIAAKRFIVEREVLPTFTDLFLRELNSQPIAPLAREDLRAQLHAQVEKSVAEGARLLCGGQLPAGPGYHYPATLLAGVQPGMTAFDEELFGPVAALIEAESESAAIALANRSVFGLGAAVFTRDLAKGERIAKTELEAGSCFVNALVRSDPRLPFGGIKESGFGRELSSFGLREFTNTKTVYID